MQPVLREPTPEIRPLDAAAMRAALPDAEAAKRILDDARAARREMALMKKDCDRPGEFAPMARLLWQHVPALAAGLGAPISAGEGWPSGSKEAQDRQYGVNAASFDARRASYVADWAAPSMSRATRLLFAGPDQGSSIDNLIDRISKVEEFERRDSLQRQKRGIAAALAQGRSLG